MKRIKNNKILFLGAGASHDACYPLTANIFNELDSFYKNYNVNDYQKRWGELKASFKKFPKALEFLINSKNPEIILTLPDLLDEAKEQYEDNLSLASNNHSLLKTVTDKIHEIYDKKHSLNAKMIKNNFSMLLGHYFLMRHCEDQARTLPSYLEKMFAQFDCIITTNWDTLPERVLLKQNKWHPSDGYGFQVPLEDELASSGENIITNQSAIKIFKLHGSIGWHERDGVFYLSQHSFLQCLISNIRDQNAPRIGSGPDKDPVMLYPSYLKQLDNAVLLSIWEQARQNLEHASSITIVGYSLPKADVAIRTLLLPARSNAAAIKIINPFPKNDDSKKRWEDFFKSSDKSPEFIDQRAAEYFQ